MESKEIINRVIEFNNPTRIGLDFNYPHQKDIAWIISARLVNEKYENKSSFGYYKDEKKLVKDFKGEVRRDCWGNIFGRLGHKTKGECIKGAIQEGWGKLDSYEMPKYDKSYEPELKKQLEANKDKYLLGALPLGVFSTLINLRKIDNLLMDTVLEEDNIKKLLDKIKDVATLLIEKAANMGFDGIVIYDDWGTQSSLLMSPISFRKLFKPIYSILCEKTHQLGMKFFLHSCGYIYEIIEDFIEIGVDVFQFDQIELIGVKKLADEFGGRVTFWCPVDIQKIMKRGNKEIIQRSAQNMIDNFGKFDGGFIAKDYPTWEDIDIEDKWANWAREIFIRDSTIKKNNKKTN